MNLLSVGLKITGKLLPAVPDTIQELEEKFASLSTRVNTLEQNL
jgi:hypothetical protein